MLKNAEMKLDNKKEPTENNVRKYICFQTKASITKSVNAYVEKVEKWVKQDKS